MASNSQIAGRVMTGCGCFSIGVMFLWLIFVAIIGIQGRGNDAEASLIIGSISCVASLPILLFTVIGAVLAFRKPPEES